MIATVVAFVLVAYLPGAALYRLPWWHRDRRAALDAEERVFWHVSLSITWSLSVVLALAALERYRFELLLMINAGIVAASLLAARRRLTYAGQASRPSWTVVMPICLIVLGLWRFWPVSEYIIGGKDPGAYISEGIQIAQRGTLVIKDETLAAIPAFARDLFSGAEYRDSQNFMGFVAQDPLSGRVVGQFPHLFPASIAIGYGLDGVSGARETVAVWGLLGLLAVYFAGARLFGRWPAFAAATLLGLHVVQIWYSRYPNSDIVLQAGLFAALLAFARAHQDDDRFFGPVAAWMIGLQLFSRMEALLAVVVMTGTVPLLWLATSGDRFRFRFLVPMAACAAVGLYYLTGLMQAYFWLANVYLTNLPPPNVAAGVAVGVALTALLGWARRRHPGAARRWIPIVVSGGMVALATYAYLFRQQAGKLAQADADSLRTFVDVYVWWPMLIAALAGLVLTARRHFWRDPAFILTLSAFSIFLFYKLHVVPEHFWLARRFLAIILPGTLLLAAAAVLGPLTGRLRGLALLRPLSGALFLALVAQHYVVAAAPIVPHVEYRNIIPYVEHLASRFTSRDLVIVESRNSESDVHVLALPLAYIYAKSVLSLNSPKPDLVTFRVFLEDALQRYERVFFVGTGGTALLSRTIVATSVDSDRVQIDEFEVTRDRLPQLVHAKEFDYGVYQLTIGRPTSGPFTLDVGLRDDLHVVRFHAKEQSDGRTIRWTQDASEVAVPGLDGQERTVAFVMSGGGRPATATPARVRILFNGVPIGETAVLPDFQSYSFPIPAELAAAAALVDAPATLRIESTIWSPSDSPGARDTRELGVMVDSVTVR